MHCIPHIARVAEFLTFTHGCFVRIVGCFAASRASPPQSYFCSAVSDTYYLVIAYHNYIVIAYHNYLVIAYHFSKTFCGAITATILSPCKEPYHYVARLDQDI